jgi:hypothetical protein
MKVNAALSYARHGIPVFPVHWIERGKCTCHKPDCGSPGKHPLIVGWQAEATADSAVIKAWWGRYPNANIGVLTGKRSHVTVADIDGDVGKDTLRDLESKNEGLPETPRVITGSGGYHYYFQHEPELTNAVRFAPGLDIRTEGGFVVGAGSANVRGALSFRSRLIPRRSPAGKNAAVADRHRKDPEREWQQRGWLQDVRGAGP